MPSVILGRLDLDDEALQQDLATIRTYPAIAEEYNEYSSGFWQNCSLWNASGDETDTMYRDFDHPIKQTEYGRRLPYIDRLLKQNFAFDHLKMVRIRILIDAIVIPHKDFVEIERGAQHCFRVFVALEDNPAAFHSDEENVFRMRKGEIWFLDASIVHAAANFSNKSRVALCLDWIFPGEFDPADIFVDKSPYDRGIAAEVVERQERSANFEASVLNLASVITRHNFKDIVFLLGKVHFSTDVPVAACYDWLVDIGYKCGDPAIADKAEALRRYLTIERKLGERFSFSEWTNRLNAA